MSFLRLSHCALPDLPELHEELGRIEFFEVCPGHQMPSEVKAEVAFGKITLSRFLTAKVLGEMVYPLANKASMVLSPAGRCRGSGICVPQLGW